MEAILATDLKMHFDILSEWKAKVSLTTFTKHVMAAVVTTFTDYKVVDDPYLIVLRIAKFCSGANIVSAMIAH